VKAEILLQVMHTTQPQESVTLSTPIVRLKYLANVYKNIDGDDETYLMIGVREIIVALETGIRAD
jgi:hypothetical protein